MVLILQRIEGKTYLDVKKNRFDGDIGRVYLNYSSITGSFYEVDPPPTPVKTNNFRKIQIQWLDKQATALLKRRQEEAAG